MVFHKNLSDSKFYHVSRHLLGILADLNNVVVCVRSILPQIFNSSSFFFKFLGTILRTSITISSPSCSTPFFLNITGKIPVFVYFFVYFHSFFFCVLMEHQNIQDSFFFELLLFYLLFISYFFLSLRVFHTSFKSE